ncbi:MFS transporter [Myxococcaceae bacterium JPH2]|nr:MFS transporter [Myxococcaceae bacterium JPH2]
MTAASTSGTRGITHPSSVFFITWAGLAVSWFGSGLMSFAIGTVVYQRTGSITEYSLFSFFYFVPLALVSPIAGALVDRWDRRSAILLSDVGAGLSSALIWAMLVASDAGHWKLETWHFYVLIALSSAFVALHGPAYYATTSLLVPKNQLGRANGLIELAFGAGQILSPIVAGSLVGRIGLKGIVFMDVMSFAFSIATLLIVRLPRPPPLASDQVGTHSLRRDIGEGWHFIRQRRGLFQLVVFVLFLNLNVGMVASLITPLVLAFSDVSTLGRVMSFSGLGMVAGGIAMSVWGGPKRRIHGILGFYLLSSFVLLAAAMPPTAVVIATAAFFYLSCSPIIVGCLSSLWQSKVPPALQGRVFSVRRMISLSAPPLAALLGGPIADKLFEPWLAPTGLLANSVGRVIGTGPGRGIALLFLLMSLGMMVQSVLSYLSPHIRNLEDELPDALPETVSEATPAQVTPAA